MIYPIDVRDLLFWFAHHDAAFVSESTRMPVAHLLMQIAATPWSAKNPEGFPHAFFSGSPIDLQKWFNVKWYYEKNLV